MIFGLYSIIHPEFPWPEIGKTDAAFPIQFFAVRHLAFGVVLLFGFIKKDVAILLTSYSIFLIIAILDFTLLALYGYYIPVLVNLVGQQSMPLTVLISTSMFILPMALTVRYLRGIKQPIPKF